MPRRIATIKEIHGASGIVSAWSMGSCAFNTRCGHDLVLDKTSSESEVLLLSDTRFDKADQLKKGSYSNSRSDGISYKW